jgi:DNA-binding transcriptional MerR regulator
MDATAGGSRYHSLARLQLITQQRVTGFNLQQYRLLIIDPGARRGRPYARDVLLEPNVIH